MNFYNPYYYNIPMSLSTSNVGFLGRLFGRTGISISNFLNGTQKVLNIANQTIPLVKQIKPVVGNAKTVFKVMNEFKKVNIPTTNDNNKNNIPNTNIENKINPELLVQTNIEGPTFFV